MDFFKKLLKVRNALGLLIIGLFAVIVCGAILINNREDILVPAIGLAVGVILIIAGIISVKKGATESTAQYDRVDPQKAEAMRAQTVKDPDEPVEDFVYHFTGKLNQSQIMKSSDGTPVYEAVCNGVKLIKDTSYTFRDCITNTETEKMIGHTVSHSIGNGAGFEATISSSFTVDQVPVWDVLAGMGYGFRFSLNGIKPHYEVTLWSENIGWVESAGTGAMNPKYADSAIGKMPTRGIYRVHGRRSDIPGLFLICFALSRTDETLN